MPSWIVTLKLPKGHSGPHDMRNKVTGPCPLPPHQSCTDVTGEHHSTVWEAADIEEVVARAESQRAHLTRVELLQAAQSTTVSQDGVSG